MSGEAVPAYFFSSFMSWSDQLLGKFKAQMWGSRRLRFTVRKALEGEYDAKSQPCSLQVWRGINSERCRQKPSMSPSAWLMT